MVTVTGRFLLSVPRIRSAGLRVLRRSSTIGLLTGLALPALFAIPLQAQTTVLASSDRDLVAAGWAFAQKEAENADKKGAKEQKNDLKQQNEEQANNDEEQEADEPGGVRFLLRKPPSLRFGNVLRVDFRAKLQFDWRGFDPEINTNEGLFDLHRRRLSLQGRFLKNDFEYEVESEVRRTRNNWRDVFVNFRRLREFQVQGGKFKVPFSLDLLTGDMDLGFVNRSLIGATLAPGRDVGVMAHGRFFKDHDLNYQFGVFRDDGDNARISEPFFLLPGETPPQTERSVAGRVTFKPIKAFEFGGSVTSSKVPEGLNSLEARTVFGKKFFPHVYVRGRRLRWGTEAHLSPDPIHIKAEYIRVEDQRKGQGLRNDDLPNFVAQGWYVSGTWLIVGKKKMGGDENAPGSEFPVGGVGALELAARVEELELGSDDPSEPPFRNPRAANLLENRNRVLTFGGTWYMNRFMKIQINGVRESILDTEEVDRSPIFGRQVFWAAVARLQFVL